MRRQGKITRWDDEKGFGFISAGGDDGSVFVHIKAFGRRGRRPQVGDLVSYTLTEDERGRPRAAKARFPKQGLERFSSLLGYLSSLIPVVLTALFALSLWAGWQLGHIPRSILALYLVMSVVTFLFYGWDKAAARQGRWRTSEAKLLFLGLAGGWPGAFVGQRVLRHKSVKRDFLDVFWITVVLNIGLLAYLVWSGKIVMVDQPLEKLWQEIARRAAEL